MESYSYLLYLAIILVLTKVFGLFSRKLNMPAVVGAIIAGVLIGPAGLNLVNMNSEAGNFIMEASEIGVIFLMFSAGLETDIKELNSNKKSAFVTAIIGVLFPLIFGSLVYLFMFKPDTSNYIELLQTVFIGVLLTATSVSITVEALKEMGRLKGRVGTTILGAAIIDDILGIVILSVITSLTDTSVELSIVILKIVLYFVMIAALAFLLNKSKAYIERIGFKRRVPIIAIAFCLFLAFASEHFFGVADITGAYFAGLLLSYMNVSEYIKIRVETPSYLFFSPIFFAYVGMQTDFSGMTKDLILFTFVLFIVALITKLVGCGLGAKVTGLTTRESVQVGIGMISRGEVALIMAQKGTSYGLIDPSMFAPIIIVVILTTLITPILLKVAFNRDTPAQKKRVTN